MSSDPSSVWVLGKGVERQCAHLAFERVPQQKFSLAETFPLFSKILEDIPLKRYHAAVIPLARPGESVTVFSRRRSCAG